MFVKFIFIFHLVVTGNCFLLDVTQNNGGETQTNSQFLTLFDFQQEKRTLQQETESLRRDLDRTILLLTTQLKQKFDFLEHKVEENSKKNDTDLDYVRMDRYLAVEQKFNQLQKENNGLKRDYNLVKNELRLLQNATSEYERKLADLQQLGNMKQLQEIGALQLAVQTNTATMQSLSMNERARSQDFLALYNLTMESKSTNDLFKHDVNNQLTSMRINHYSNFSYFNSEIQATEKRNNLTVTHLEGKFTDMNNKLAINEANYNDTIMKIRSKIDQIEKESNLSIALLTEIGIMQHALQTNTATIQSLSMNERSRSQDFLALYNLTMELKKTFVNQLASIWIHHNSSLIHLKSDIQATEKRNNLTFGHFEGTLTAMNNTLIINEANNNVTFVEIRSKLDRTAKESKSSIALLKKQMDEKVALTSHPTSGSIVRGGNIIKFNNVAFSVGINNLLAYKSSGKFVCESSGLYLISVSIATSMTGNPEYGIALNGTYISRTEVGFQSGSQWRTGSSIVSRYLDVNDSILIYAIRDMFAEESTWSQFTILKIN